jgi:hypothetical protein
VLSDNTVFISENGTSHMGGGMVMHTAYFKTSDATSVNEDPSTAPVLSIAMENGTAMLLGAPAGAVVMMLDSTGRIVRTDKTTATRRAYDTSGLGSGVYTVVATSPQGRAACSFVVAH